MQQKHSDYENYKARFETKLKNLMDKMQEDLLYRKYEYNKATGMLQEFVEEMNKNDNDAKFLIQQDNQDD